jgi:hypothetical protein
MQPIVRFEKPIENQSFGAVEPNMHREFFTHLSGFWDELRLYDAR